MTVNDIISKIDSLNKTIEHLEKLREVYSMNTGEGITISDAVDAIDEYIIELKNKKVQ